MLLVAAGGFADDGKKSSRPETPTADGINLWGWKQPEAEVTKCREVTNQAGLGFGYRDVATPSGRAEFEYRMQCYEPKHYFGSFKKGDNIGVIPRTWLVDGQLAPSSPVPIPSMLSCEPWRVVQFVIQNSAEPKCGRKALADAMKGRVPSGEGGSHVGADNNTPAQGSAAKAQTKKADPAREKAGTTPAVSK
jgi:hypothetical protein